MGLLHRFQQILISCFLLDLFVITSGSLGARSLRIAHCQAISGDVRGMTALDNPMYTFNMTIE